MKIEQINGKVVVINETFAEAFETFNECLVELGEKPVTENTARRDFGIEGGESNADLQIWAQDYHSDLQSERAESNAWKKNQGYWDEGDSIDMSLQY